MVTVPSRPRKFTIPPLENGDRLSRSEFERRYEAMTDIKRLTSLKEPFIWRRRYALSPMRM